MTRQAHESVKYWDEADEAMIGNAREKVIGDVDEYTESVGPI